MSMDLPWEIEAEDTYDDNGKPLGRTDSIRIDAAPLDNWAGWVEITTTGQVFLSPERARQAIAAIEAALERGDGSLSD